MLITNFSVNTEGIFSFIFSVFYSFATIIKLMFDTWATLFILQPSCCCDRFTVFCRRGHFCYVFELVQQGDNNKNHISSL